MIRTTSLQDWFVDTTTPSNDADHGAIQRRQNLLCARWKLDTGLLCVWIVSDDCTIVTAGTCELATISGLLLNVAHNRTFGHVAEWENISNGELSLLAAVDELAGVHALDGDEEFLAELVAVWIAEMDDGEWSATAWIVDDFLREIMK